MWTSGLQEKAPYDLIVANIVANPLIALSVDIAGAPAVTGRIVLLVGILLDQVEEVAASYAENGLRLTERIEMGDWATLTLGQSSSLPARQICR